MSSRANVCEPGTSSEYWDRVFASRRWGAYPPEELIRFIVRSFGSASRKEDVRVLEVGCGPGPNIWYLVREGFTVAGIDGSATAVGQARDRLASERLPHSAPRVDLRVGDFCNLPWADASFNAVVDVEALYANPIAKVRRSIREFMRVLKLGGVFFGKMFGVATTGSDTGTLIEPGTRRHPTAGPCTGNDIAHFFSRAELDELFGDFEGLSIDQTCRTDCNGEVHIFEWLVSARKRLGARAPGQR